MPMFIYNFSTSILCPEIHSGYRVMPLSTLGQRSAESKTLSERASDGSLGVVVSEWIAATDLEARWRL